MTTLDYLAALATGLGAGLALIIAIGSQNAFVLRQGLRGEHVGAVVLICMLSDMALIWAGIAGIGAVLDTVPGVVLALRFAGAAFLVAYGLLAAQRALHPRALTASTGTTAGGRRTVLLTVLALTWLNPHVYLDTVLLLGSMAHQHGELRWWFGAGAAAGSVVWFSALGFGARFLRPVFARPAAWRILDAGIAVLLVFLGVRMALGG